MVGETGGGEGKLLGEWKLANGEWRMLSKLSVQPCYGPFLFLLGSIYGQNTSEINFFTCAIDMRFWATLKGIHS